MTAGQLVGADALGALLQHMLQGLATPPLGAVVQIEGQQLVAENAQPIVGGPFQTLGDVQNQGLVALRQGHEHPAIWIEVDELEPHPAIAG